MSRWIARKVGWTLMGFPCVVFLWGDVAVHVPWWKHPYRWGSRLHDWGER